MIVEVPVIQTPERTQQVVNTSVQHIVDTVEVEKPKIIDETVQKPTIQEKINQVTKHVEVPLVQFLDKVEEIPVVAQRQIPIVVQTVQKTIEIPQLQCIDEVIDVPTVLVVPVPQVQVSEKTVEISQLQTAEKIVDTFDANGNRVANELRRRDCVMREMRKNKPPFRLALNRAASDEIAQHCKHCTERGVTKLHGSGTALAEGMRVPVSKMEELIAVHCQASLKTVKDPDREPYPAYPSGKSWCEACGKTDSGKKFHHNVMSGVDFATEAQQQHKSNKHNNYHSKEAMQQRERKEEKGLGEREKGRKDEVGRDQEGGRKEKERKPEVKKDVTGWTVVTRNRRQRKMVQIFVRVNGSKATPMDVNLTDDKVEDVIRRIQNDEDVYVTMHGRVLRRDEKLKSCEVTDGCTIQVTSRLRGGGKHKDKRSKADTKQGMDKSGQKDQQVESLIDKCQEATQAQKDVMIQLFEENDAYRRMITMISEAEDEEHEIQRFGKQLQSGVDEERAKLMKLGMRWAVEARKRGRGAEQEQRRQEEQRQRRHEEQGQNAGRGSAGLVRGGDERCQTDETSRKGKGKGNGGKGEHDGKAGGAGSKGRQQVENLVMDEGQENMRAKTSEENHEEDMRKLLEMVEREEMELEMMQQEEMEHEEQRGRVAPNMGAGGSHPQATSDTRKKKVLRWADCNDEEGKENEEEVEEEKEAGQWEKTEERPPGLEEVESKQEAKKEQEAERKQKQEQEEGGDREKEVEEKKEQEAERKQKQEQEQEKRAQEAREELKRAQEAREEERKAQEAHEEQKRAQKALEKRKAQEEQEREAKAQEERKKEVRVQEERERVAREAKAQEEREKAKAQEEREREVNAHEERREQEREAEAQEGHEGEVKAQEEQGEDSNSLQEESHVSNRHMTWWHNAWWVRVNNGPHLRTARDRRRVWRAATRAAQEVRDTGKVAGGEREKWETGSKESNASNTLHIVFHFPTATTSTQQQQPQQQQQQCVPVGVHQRVLQ